jgi:hypothetical protein
VKEGAGRGGLGLGLGLLNGSFGIQIEEADYIFISFEALNF